VSNFVFHFLVLIVHMVDLVFRKKLQNVFHITYMRCSIYAYGIRSRFFSRSNAFPLLFHCIFYPFDLPSHSLPAFPTPSVASATEATQILRHQHQPYLTFLHALTPCPLHSISRCTERPARAVLPYTVFFCSITLDSTGFRSAPCMVLLSTCVQSSRSY